MADLNQVVLIGRLTRDAELKYTSGGFAISNLSLAINKRRKNGDQWVEEAHFFDVNIYGKTAESLKQYLVKGKQIAIQGELRQDRWEKDGQKHSKITIDANNVQLLGGNSGTSGSNSGSYSSMSNNAGGYGQNQNSSNNQSYQPRYDAPQNQYDPGSSFGQDESFPEDIPF